MFYSVAIDHVQGNVTADVLYVLYILYVLDKLYIYLVFFSIAHASAEKRSEKIE